MKLIDLHKEIGTAKDNQSSPVHDWYRFTAGFSYKLVDKIIREEELGKKDFIYESFAGCGTTLVSAQKNSIKAVGNEAQELLFDVINAKLNWNLNVDNLTESILRIEKGFTLKTNMYPYHDLLKTLYDESDLYQLYFIRDFLKEIRNKEEYIFLKLALTQTLHKVSIHPIAVPYISRSKTLSGNLSASETFRNTALKMIEDLKTVENLEKTTSIYFHDSRKKNHKIDNDSCSICITSPPYLNNLDYGEVSKVCSHFFGITDNWQDITEKVRRNLVTGATTHYKESDFDIDQWKKKEFYQNNKNLMDGLLPDILKIQKISKTRKGKKSFHILVLYYFEDMYKVLIEMRRVLQKGSKAYLVLGDSAPYGVFIDTINILGKIALGTGFEKYNIIKIRERGTKWQSLKFRHSLKLSESILILE